MFVSNKPDPETEIGLKEEPVNIGDPPVGSIYQFTAVFSGES